MKVIDVHIHVGHRFEWTGPAKKVWMDTGPYVPSIFNDKQEQLAQQYGDTIKKEGVFGGILIPEYSPSTAGVMPIERAIEINARHPELIPVAHLNPNYHDDLPGAFEEQIKAGARGLKIHPIHGFFYANDKRLYEIYERCEKEGLPVMFHAGSSLFRGTKMRYSDPYTFDDVISDFPDMKVVLCHGGRGFWYNIAEFMAKSFRDVYIDLSGLPPKNLLRYFPSMKRFSHKYLFGTDFPGVPGIRKNFREVCELIKDDKAMELIGFRNAYELFGFWKEGIFEISNTDEDFESTVAGLGMAQWVLPGENGESLPDSGTGPDDTGSIRFYGYRKEMQLLGVMAKKETNHSALLRYAFLARDFQNQGGASRLLAFIEQTVKSPWLLVDLRKAVPEVREFFLKSGFTPAQTRTDLPGQYLEMLSGEAGPHVIYAKCLGLP